MTSRKLGRKIPMVPIAQPKNWNAAPISFKTIPPTKAAIEAGLAAMGIDEAQRTGQVFDLSPWWAKLDKVLPEVTARAMGGIAS